MSTSGFERILQIARPYCNSNFTSTQAGSVAQSIATNEPNVPATKLHGIFGALANEGKLPAGMVMAFPELASHIHKAMSAVDSTLLSAQGLKQPELPSPSSTRYKRAGFTR